MTLRLLRRHLTSLTIFGSTLGISPFELPAQTVGGLGGAEKFKQMGTDLPTPNGVRTASGAPGRDYWQQKVDYEIDATLDDMRQRLTGRERITYHNNSPDTLRFLWVQLDQNLFTPNSIGNLTRNGPVRAGVRASSIIGLGASDSSGYFGGYTLSGVTSASGAALATTVNGTMMRVELGAPLPPGGVRALRINWTYPILPTTTNQAQGNPRSGQELFPRDGNYVYNVAQWFPRLAVYGDNAGWQNKQFLGGGEFTLPFGDYTVRITVPADHIVAATGTLANPLVTLSVAQRARLVRAQTSDSILHIVTPAEARANETSHSTATKTWVFQAQNVRDFAFATSRKFIWDARGVSIAGKRVIAQSYYPLEAEPLWGQYSTRAVAHALVTYSRHTIPYPYPQATSVHWNGSGMEYPMICFNPRRPNADGSYDDATKFGLISVVIHEVGHNFFPMIVNSDERQWTWMDEGLNSFTQYLSEREWDAAYPSRRGPARNVVDYMRLDKTLQEPIMTNSESVQNLGNNAYLKASTALNILRETVMGPALFDAAFKEYARRWAFKHPTPADFFRTLEDVSAVDLDWYWRGWFYGVDNVDVAIDTVIEFRLDQPATGGAASAADRDRVQKFMAGLSASDRATLGGKRFLYEVNFKNVGGLVMPLAVEFEYDDGTRELVRIPAEIWRVDAGIVTKAFATSKKVTAVTLDPAEETADTELANNTWPRRNDQTKFQRFRGQIIKPLH
ncbi:MAG: M1 family metallopeptidase [Gemmatimonadaceae bacterium]|nr:M1 family metallopeptidase [Gemmatimonadaceae bacterium]